MKMYNEINHTYLGYWLTKMKLEKGTIEENTLKILEIIFINLF